MLSGHSKLKWRAPVNALNNARFVIMYMQGGGCITVHTFMCTYKEGGGGLHSIRCPYSQFLVQRMENPPFKQ